MSGAPLLELRGLTVAYRADGGELRAVEGVDLELQAGEMLALVGESGCGKSSLLLAIPGLLPESARVAGSIRLEGRELAGLGERELRAVRGRRIACVFQDPLSALDPVQRVGAQVAEPLRAHLGLPRAAALRRAQELLARVGLEDPGRAAQSFPHELSGGQRQRALLALALSCDPALLLADEPASALDTPLQARLLELLARLRRELSLAVLLVTHDLTRAARHADALAVMYGGRVVEQGCAQRVLAAPRHPYTAALKGALPARRGEALRPIPGSVPQGGCWPAGCRFRTRCTRAQPRCAEAEPRLELQAELPRGQEPESPPGTGSPPRARGHSAACFFPLEAVP